MQWNLLLGTLNAWRLECPGHFFRLRYIMISFLLKPHHLSWIFPSAQLFNFFEAHNLPTSLRWILFHEWIISRFLGKTIHQDAETVTAGYCSPMYTEGRTWVSNAKLKHVETSWQGVILFARIVHSQQDFFFFTISTTRSLAGGSNTYYRYCMLKKPAVAMLQSIQTLKFLSIIMHWIITQDTSVQKICISLEYLKQFNHIIWVPNNMDLKLWSKIIYLQADLNSSLGIHLVMWRNEYQWKVFECIFNMHNVYGNVTSGLR